MHTARGGHGWRRQAHGWYNSGKGTGGDGGCGGGCDGEGGGGDGIGGGDEIGGGVDGGGGEVRAAAAAHANTQKKRTSRGLPSESPPYKTTKLVARRSGGSSSYRQVALGLLGLDGAV